MRDEVRERYYKHRAPVYDETSYRGDPEVNAGLDRETAEIGKLLSELPPARVLDVGCGTGVWTRFLQGEVTAMDQSQEMLDIARERVPEAKIVHALFPPLPFPDDSFDTIFTANFYGLLRPDERAEFLKEAARVAKELIVVDLRADGDTPTEGPEKREVQGTQYEIYRRRFLPDGLAKELDGELNYPGQYFLMVTKRLDRDAAA